MDFGIDLNVSTSTPFLSTRFKDYSLGSTVRTRFREGVHQRIKKMLFESAPESLALGRIIEIATVANHDKAKAGDY